MKSFVVAFTIAMLTAASAQTPPPLKTINLYNNATKEPLGTATYSGTRIYMRDKNGEHYATIVVEPDGSNTAYDSDGKIIKQNRKGRPNE